MLRLQHLSLQIESPFAPHLMVAVILRRYTLSQKKTRQIAEINGVELTLHTHKRDSKTGVIYVIESVIFSKLCIYFYIIYHIFNTCCRDIL